MWARAIARERGRKPGTRTREASGAGPNQNLKPETGIQNAGWSQAIAREPGQKLELKTEKQAGQVQTGI